MSLRRKTLIAIGLTSLGLLLFLFALAQIILLRGFDQLQAEAVQQNVQLVRNIIANEIDNLNATATDWGYWDDTYQFIQDKNQDYIDANLSDSSISTLNFNVFIYTDTNDQLVFGKMANPKENRTFPLPLDLESQSDVLRPLLDLPDLMSNNTGIVLSSQGPLLVVARSILTSQRTGPATGKLIFGRLLDDAKIQEFAEQSQLAIAIYLLDAADLPSEFATARTALLSSGAPAVIYTLQDQTAEGYSLLNDISGNPVLILKMGMSNSIYQQGQRTILYFVIALLIAGLTFGAVMMWVLEKIVLSRLGYLNQRVSEIASSNKLSERITMDGSDELSSLTATINTSLGVMEQSQVELQQLNTQLEEKVTDLNILQTYRDRFFANASHEFSTPIATLRTQLYLAQKQPEQWQKHLDSLTATTNRLSGVVSDVFDMAQFKRQSGLMSRQEVEFKGLVSKIIAVERQVIYQKGLQLSTELPHYEVYIQGDQSALENAVEKLLKFITNFCSHGSTVQIALSAHMNDDTTYAHLEISSSGLQIAPSDLNQIFLPFYKSSEGNIHNTGLQLSITKEIIQLHKGEISTKVDAERGVCFGIKLPVTHVGEALVPT